MKITLKEGAIPVQKPCCRIPVKLRDKFKEEVESLVSKGVLTKLHENEATEWLNSFVTVTKENGSLRLCLDPTDLNQHIVRPVCPSYTLDEISYKLRNAKVFSVVDATKGFFQVPLSEESKLLTAMLTPLGVYMYNVLAMGLSLASDVFEQIIRKIISDLPGVLNIADDLLIFGQDDKDHDECFIRLLDRCREVGLTLNPAKFKFKCRSVPFFGNVVGAEGIQPDPQKVAAIQDWPTPTCVKDLQSFLGAVNFLNKFIPSLSALRQPLQGLIKKDTEWRWTQTHQIAFDNIKQAISTDALLRYFDPNKPLFIEVDASGAGIGAVLLQGDVTESNLKGYNASSGEFLSFRDRLKPVAYASKSLSDAERRYSNIERELLGVVFAILHFNHYTFANRTFIISDHKPLLPLFSGKSLVSCSPRTARLLLKIVDRDIRFFYQKGSSMCISDALSRLPDHNAADGNKTEVKGLNITVHDISPDIKPFTLQVIREETAKCPTMQFLVDHIQKGWPEHTNQCLEQLREYFPFRSELSLCDGLIFKGDRVLIPQKMRTQALDALHASHQGIVKTKSRARSSMFWPNINKDIEELCQNCATCLKFSSRQQAEPIGRVQEFSEAWQGLATDIFEFNGHSYLILVCRFSGQIVVRPIKDHSTESTINILLSVFAEHGLPEYLHCDRGTNYTSVKFQDFCRSLNIKLSFSSAEHHSSNHAERAVQTVKNAMKKSNNWYLALLEIMMTPQQGMSRSPMELMKHRTVKGLLPCFKSNTNDQVLENRMQTRQKQHFYHNERSREEEYPLINLGSNILFQAHDNTWQPGVVIDRLHDRQYKIVTANHKIITRNRVQIKPNPNPVNFEVRKPNLPSTPALKPAIIPPKPSAKPEPQVYRTKQDIKPAGNSDRTNGLTTCSGRNVKRPAYLKDYV